METSQANRYITPTLQANWNLAISDVIRCLNADLIYEAWLALQTLYDILPPEIHKKVEKDYKKLKTTYEAHYTESTGYEAIVSTYFNGLETLRNETRPFFRLMYELLYGGGYLEKQAGPSTKVTGLSKLEQTLG